jgi:hypothetical protein
MADALDSSVALGIAVVAATFLGPVFAVLVTRYLDKAHQLRERRLGIFCSLMATRRAALAPDKVRALNMVEIEFYGIQPVLKAHQNVIVHINTPPKPDDGWDEKLRKLTTKLLTEMAAVLGYNLQQLDVLDGGYYPQGFADIELEQQAVRRVIIEVLSGHRPLIVSPAAPTPPAPFPMPPPPVPTGNKK